MHIHKYKKVRLPAVEKKHPWQTQPVKETTIKKCECGDIKK